MKLRSTTKMAYQAALAIALAELISIVFYIDKGYWITLTAMALTTQTWGESVKRSFERIGMTVLGGVVGTLLYFSIPPDEYLVFQCLMLFFIFFAIYMAKIQHLIFVFFMTCFIVFLFALISDWSLMLLRTRIIDTALGAVIALGVGSLFFSFKTNIDTLFIDYLQKMKAVMSTAFHLKSQHQPFIMGQSLLVDFQKIRKNALTIRYELLFHRLSSRDFNMLLNRVAFCTQLVTSIVDVYHWMVPHLTRSEKVKVSLAIKTTKKNLETIIERLKNNNHMTMLPATNLTALLTKAIADDPHRFATLESDALGFYNLMYFFTRLNIHLHEIYDIVNEAY